MCSLFIVSHFAWFWSSGDKLLTSEQEQCYPSPSSSSDLVLRGEGGYIGKIIGTNGTLQPINYI